ncbi:hypothetical protein [Mameliella alba]|uniref:Uncharacterized protein n=1 Tax=Mameliella alba TaxID=561184 RepID=A0A0B3RST8_9RHOB|nr:hypothetical protein [Mameliella alba]MBV6635168.1 hypothetical protein [Mameliella sp.]KHQ54045.1 hypothetical protein OA50_01273 [Mameliella alba]OWV45505.1 hypothetical protein CDZ95_00625 [Mameliella alba]OWV65749.1 hypothetical protein CDZ97_07725 [Mameliella alba]BBU56380.1 hypothetical protein KU6B_26450 [Mameliella alba]
MPSHQDQLRTLLNALESCDLETRIDVVREVAVPLLEHLGYSLARDAAATAASSAFILAADLEKRLAKIGSMISEDDA